MNANLFFSIVCGLCMIVFFMVILMTTNRQRGNAKFNRWQMAILTFLLFVLIALFAISFTMIA